MAIDMEMSTHNKKCSKRENGEEQNKEIRQEPKRNYNTLLTLRENFSHTSALISASM